MHDSTTTTPAPEAEKRPRQGLPRVAAGRCAYCHGPIRHDGVRDGRHVVHTRHLDLWRSWLQRPAGLR